MPKKLKHPIQNVDFDYLIHVKNRKILLSLWHRSFPLIHTDLSEETLNDLLRNQIKNSLIQLKTPFRSLSNQLKKTFFLENKNELAKEKKK